MNAFIDLVRDIFPASIPPFTAEKAKEALKQFRKEQKFGEQSIGLGKEYDFFDMKSVDFLRQGDIIDGLNFFYLNSNGEIKILKNIKGILLSNTCDASRDKYLHFAPLLPIDNLLQEFTDDEKKNNFLNNLHNNTIFRYICFPHKDLDKYAVNLNLINNIPIEIVNKNIKDGVFKKEYSLNTIGFYFLLCKLTVYFMREEKPKETNRDYYESAL
ncbi:MAG: hypothetical protein ACLR02_13220 [Clostridium sp.]